MILVDTSVLLPFLARHSTRASEAFADALSGGLHPGAARSYFLRARHDLPRPLIALTPIEDRADCIPWIKADSKIDPLSSDPRYARLMRRIGLPP